METENTGSSFIPMPHMPHWMAEYLGSRHGRSKKDGSKWVSRQMGKYERFEIRQLRKCSKDLLAAHRQARKLCGNIDRALIHSHVEVERLRAIDDCKRWLAQLDDIQILIRNRELDCIHRCMEQDKLRSDLIGSYLEGFEAHMPTLSHAGGRRIGDPLYTGDSEAWQTYAEAFRELHEDMKKKLDDRKGV